MKKILLLLMIGLFSVNMSKSQASTGITRYDYTNYSEVDGCKFRMWVPPTTQKVKGLVVAFSQMQETVGLDSKLRNVCLLEDLAIVWASSLGENDYSKLVAGLESLAEVSGMPEISSAPYALVAHSTAGIFCRTIATENPSRCFAVVQLSAVDYRDNDKIKDIPWITIKNGSEETVDTWEQARYFLVNAKEAYKNPDGTESTDDKAWASPRGNGCRISMISFPGGGHFGWSEFESKLVTTFIRKAAHYQLSLDTKEINRIPENQGWLTDTAFVSLPSHLPASYSDYTGDKAKAFWHLDKEMAYLWTDMHQAEVGKTPQNLTMSTFGPGGNPGVWQTAPKMNLRNGDGINNPYPNDATADTGMPLKAKLYYGLYKVKNDNEIYFSPARYEFIGNKKDWITFYQEGDETFRYAEITSGQVEVNGIPRGAVVNVSNIEDKDIFDEPIPYNAESSDEIDDFIVSGNIYQEGDNWVIDKFTSVPKSQVYIRFATPNQAVKETKFEITNSRETQIVNFDSSIPKELVAGEPQTIVLKANSTGQQAEISYYLISGPAELEGAVLTTTGEEGVINLVAVATNETDNPGKAILEINVNDATTGIISVISSDIQVSPTVTEDLVKIKNAPIGSNAYIFDCNGRVIMKKLIEKEESVISLSNLNSGIYFLSIEGIQTSKIIKK